ncbi:sugar phosphate isomerase/epimerase [Blautia pseudococcoides]|uniref:sugar phosphate isomerase/epimerase family protein n=1 Tax=Blautia pseudococcoides TaxID=1796616 RepID=UPI003512FA88
MKLGVRAHDYGRHTPEKLAGILKKEGFASAQVALHKAVEGVDKPFRVKKEILKNIKLEFQKKDVEIAVLGCYMDLSARDESVKKEHIINLEAGIRYGKYLGAGMTGTETSYGVLNLEEKRETRKQVWDTIDRLLATAQEQEICLGIEPVAAHTLYSPEWTKELIRDMSSPWLKIIFDPVNLLTKDRIQDQEELWKECFETFGEKIGVVHLKDCLLGRDGSSIPCPLGKGLMKYDCLFDWLKKNKPDISVLREEITMEHAHEDIAFMRDFLGE